VDAFYLIIIGIREAENDSKSVADLDIRQRWEGTWCGWFRHSVRGPI